MVGKHFSGFRSSPITIIQLVFDHRVRRGEEAFDALFLMDDPTFHPELSELGTAGEERFFKRAKEGWVRQSLKSDGRGFDGELSGVVAEIAIGISAMRLQEFAKLIGQDTRSELGTATGPFGCLDFASPEFYPITS